MTIKRKPKRKGRYRGQRTHGAGNTKNRRGFGNKGGHGNAGLAKHRFTWVTAYAPDYFGKHGFTRPVKRKLVPIAHLYEIQRQITLGKISKKDSKYYFEFRGKILSTGVLNHPVSIKALSWSRKTEEKVKKAGGEIVKFE